MRSKPMILVALLLAAFVINLDTTLVNVALPSLVRELHATTTQLQWVVDAYNLVFAALLLTFGSLSDRLGRKGVLLAGLVTFGAASLAGGFTTSPAALIAARSVMGLGAAMTFPATLSLITNVFTERRERARAIGLWGAIAGVAIALGPIVGGWLLEHFSWASIFIAMAPVAAAAIGLVVASVPTSKNPDAAPVDIVGLALSTATMALLVFTIIEAPDYGWGSTPTLAGFAVSAALLAAFIGWERRAAHPMLDVRLFRNMRFSAASGAVTVSFFTLFGFIFLMTQYFQFVRGYGPLSTGVHQAHRHPRADRHGGLLRVGRRGHLGRHQLRDHLGPDGAVRAGHGPDLRAGHRVHHGRGVAAPGRRGVRGQRLDPAARRHAGRRGDRQRVRVAVRLAAGRQPAGRAAPRRRGDRAPVP